ncbi:MAG: pentapeptide repeat-containing protein [Anaerolineae bacterium]|jgi:uncharacterized protein YjbI with pentapeptide repeats
MASQSYDPSNIRDHLLNDFGKEDLGRLLFEVPAFRPLYDELVGGAAPAEIVEWLVAHAARTRQIPALIKLIYEFRPSVQIQRSQVQAQRIRTRHRPIRVRRPPPPPKRVVTRLRIVLDVDNGALDEGGVRALKADLARLLKIPADEIKIPGAQPERASAFITLPVADALLLLFRYRLPPDKPPAHPLDWPYYGLPKTLRDPESEEAQAIEEATQRARRLAARASRLPDAQRGELLAEALATAQAIPHPWARARALGAVATQVQGAPRQEALAALRAINPEIARASVLATLPARPLPARVQAMIRDLCLVEHGTALRGIDLSALDLRRADLDGADLHTSNLNLTCLQEASLVGTRLAQANLAGADLTTADLSGADLSGADLNRADLRRAYLSGAKLRNADLRWADLSGASLFGADLRGAAVTAAQLAGARSLQDATLPDGKRQE